MFEPRGPFWIAEAFTLRTVLSLPKPRDCTVSKNRADTSSFHIVQPFPPTRRRTDPIKRTSKPLVVLLGAWLNPTPAQPRHAPLRRVPPPPRNSPHYRTRPHRRLRTELITSQNPTAETSSARPPSSSRTRPAQTPPNPMTSSNLSPPTAGKRY